MRLTRRGLCIPDAMLPPAGALQKQLTVTPLAAEGGPGKPPQPFEAFLRTPTAIYIPRFTENLPPMLQQQRHLVTTFPRADPMAEAVAFSGELRPQQQEVAALALEACAAEGGALLVLPTGWGKTVLALYVASHLKVKTLVCAHKSFLLDQWAERIAQYLPGARVGRIQQGKVDVEGKDIVLGMLQSLSMRSYAPDTFAGFGLTIVDECHHISAPVFSQAMFKCCSKFMLGLSATPERKDGLGCDGQAPLIKWFLGSTVIDKRERNMVPATIRVVRYSCDAYDRPPPLMRGGQHINLAKIVTGLVEDPARNALVTAIVADAAGQGRNVLVLSDRRAHCRTLLSMFRAAVGSDDSSSLYVGGMKTHELADAAASRRVLFATYGLVSEGLDIKRLCTLVMATPRSEVAQAVGRVLRGAPDPQVFDVVDAYGVFYAQHSKRRGFYGRAGFVVLGERDTGATDEPPDGFAFLSDDD